MAVKPHKKGLRTKIVLAFLTIGFIPVVVGLVITYWNGTLRLRESIGANFQGLASQAAHKTDLVIEREITSKKHLSTIAEIRQALEASNQGYRGLPDQTVIERLAQRKALWESREDPSFKESLLTTNTSGYLRNYMMTKGVKYIAFFVTDEKGAIVSSANGFPDYIHSQEEWWRQTYNDGLGKVYIGDLYFSEKANVWAINIAVPVVDEKSQKVTGVLAVFHDVQEFLKPFIHDIRFGKTGHAMLIDSEGRVLTCPVMPSGSFLTDKMLVANVTSSVPKWVIARDDGHGGSNSIVGFAPAVATSEISSNSTRKTWHSFIRQDPKELYAPIRSLLVSVSLSGILLVGFVAVAGIVLSRRFAEPIQILHKGAEEIGEGNLDVKLDIRTNDEIEQLADEFNRMAGRLKESYSTLEQKVAERTQQLSALNLITATANRSLNLQEILENTLDKLVEVLQLQTWTIRLWDAAENNLILQAFRGLPMDFIQKYKELPSLDTIAGQVATSGQPLIIEDIEKTPHPDSPFFELGFVSLVSIPLKSKERVLGTLSGATRTPRSFTPQDLELLASIGNQLSIAIENATLYANAKAMVEQLKEADRFKSEFFSNMSHELRAPLTSIIGYSELLLDRTGGELNTKQSEYIGNIQSSGTLLLEIINNLLDLSKIRAGRMEIRFAEFSMRKLISSCVAAVSPLASKKGLDLESRIEEGSLMINADETKVKQILLNLLSNAVKFTPHGGSIAVYAHSSELEGQPAIEVSVTDNGIGIRQEDLTKIFEEFRQADSSYTREYPGTGLGLSIVKRFVEMHGGLVKAESVFGKGSCFTIVLPGLVESEKAAQERTVSEKTMTTVISNPLSSEVKEAETSAREAPSPTILIVEDDPASAQILKNYLNGLGYQIEHAMTGKEAIDKAKAIKPFAITLDVVLPDRDGWTVLSELKAMPETSEIPVIIVSIVDDPERGLSLGAIDYLSKPIDKQKLLDRFDKHGLLAKVRHRPITILLVDDDPVILDLMGSFLESERFGVIKSQTGAEAIDLAIRLRPDVIVLDLIMPGMDGFQVVQRLKQDPLSAQIPIVIATHKDLSPDESDFLRDKVLEIIPKGKSLKRDLVHEIRKIEQFHPEKAGMIDPLTGLYDKRYLDSFLRHFSEKGVELKRAFSLVMVRIDHFKAYIEKRGRSEGDQLIIEVSNVLRHNLRNRDVVCRCTEGTFAIVMTETTKETAITIGRKLKELWEKNTWAVVEVEPGKRLTMSVGVSTFFDDAHSVDALLDNAKRALGNAEKQ
jgi:diguanylate cyclase (GGDEF)-like protein